MQTDDHAQLDPADEQTVADQTPNAPAPTDPDDDELWDRQKVLEFFGGNKPLHASTLYRGMSGDVYPKPMKVAPNVVRWIAQECRAARQKMKAARSVPKPKPIGRGRKRRQQAKV